MLRSSERQVPVSHPIDPLTSEFDAASEPRRDGSSSPSMQSNGSQGSFRLMDVPDDLPDSVLADRVEVPAPAASRLERWYVSAVITSDVFSILLSVLIGIWIGYADSFADGSVVLTLVLVTTLGMFCALFASRAWEARVLGQGSEEFNRLIRAVISSLVVLSLVGVAVSAPGIRPWVFLVIPGAGTLAMLGRSLLRRRLHALRRQGRCMHQVLAVGDSEAIKELIDRTHRDVTQGWTVTGCCTPGGTGVEHSGEIEGVPVVGDLDALATTVLRGGYRVVAVAPCAGWSGHRLRQLAWDLEGSGVDLVVQPGLMDIAGPRLHVTPVDGLPLLRLTEPTFTGIPLLMKAFADRIVALLLLFLVAPVFLALMMAVCLDGGPAFFRQERVGKNGRVFRIFKFRSMVVDAERRRAALLAENNGKSDGAGPLVKFKDDPRVTKIGRWLRKYSLDELPQLLNVLGGSMSLVGPRPPLPTEVATYSRAAMRKLRVKPGLTGLWQISGRSDLSWEESVRLDLRYVENWNLAMDLRILWRTLGAVVRGKGAY
jgi:exopolysaccharide biosynthesis polyprenyl glycosylphosphotransferase